MYAEVPVVQLREDECNGGDYHGENDLNERIRHQLLSLLLLMLIDRNVAFFILSTTSIYYLLLFRRVFRF